MMKYAATDLLSAVCNKFCAIYCDQFRCAIANLQLQLHIHDKYRFSYRFHGEHNRYAFYIDWRKNKQTGIKFQSKRYDFLNAHFFLFQVRGPISICIMYIQAEEEMAK